MGRDTNDLTHDVIWQNRRIRMCKSGQPLEEEGEPQTMEGEATVVDPLSNAQSGSMSRKSSGSNGMICIDSNAYGGGKRCDGDAPHRSLQPSRPHWRW